MTPEYYEGIVLATLDNLLKNGGDTGLLNLVKETRLSNLTIIKYTKRLEQKGRLRVTRGSNGERNIYQITDPPNTYDRLALSFHLESRLEAR